MTTEQTTLVTLAAQLADLFEASTRQDGTEFYRLTQTSGWEIVTVYRAHLSDNTPFLDDTHIECIRDAAIAFRELPDDATEEDLRRRSSEEAENIKPLHELTAWLHENVRGEFTDYLSEAIQNDAPDAHTALAMAHRSWQTEVWEAVLEGLVERLEEIEWDITLEEMAMRQEDDDE